MHNDRFVRFGDSDSALKAYFANEHSKARMDLVRESIIEVREGWHAVYDEQLSALSAKLFPSGFAGDLEFTTKAERLFGARRDWRERLSSEDQARIGTEAVWLYTSSLGYDRMFRAVYDIFRTAGPTKDDVRLATFLVEILNIDLYNHWAANPEAQNFDGIVYRGMSIARTSYDHFRALAAGAAGLRSFSIPLALNSASVTEEQTQPFMEYGLEKHPDYIPVLHKIHVRGLSDDRLALYRKVYPESVVSTICAVPIRSLSAYPTEEEVLLRGPFFELLRTEQHPTRRVAGQPVQVFEMLMLNSNRDHFTTPQTGGNDPARRLFNALVKTQKFEACAEIIASIDPHADRGGYEALRDQGQLAVEAALRDVPA